MKYSSCPHPCSLAALTARLTLAPVPQPAARAERSEPVPAFLENASAKKYTYMFLPLPARFIRRATTVDFVPGGLAWQAPA